jgi:flagellar motor protein MotB
MILARLSRAIREQNWFAVGLEFVIVVAGVLLAFQITAWAQARADAEREALMLTRLHAEAETNVRYFSRGLERRRDNDARRDDTIQRMLANNFEGADRESMVFSIFSASNVQEPSPSRIVYDELVSAGLTSRIGDEAMRIALAEYWLEIDRLRTVSAARQQQTNVFPRAVAAQDEFIEIEYDADHPLRRRYSINFERAAQSGDFMEFILFGNAQSREMTNMWSRALADAIALCRETARLTDRSCEPADEDAS